MSEQPKCKDCGGTFLTWSLSLRSTTNIAGHNRLGLHNVVVDAVLGCEECSATVQVIDGQKLVDEMVTTSARLSSEAAALRADLDKMRLAFIETYSLAAACSANTDKELGGNRVQTHPTLVKARDVLGMPTPQQGDQDTVGVGT